MDEGYVVCRTSLMGVKEGHCDWMRDVSLWLVGPASWVLKRDIVIG